MQQRQQAVATSLSAMQITVNVTMGGSVALRIILFAIGMSYGEKRDFRIHENVIARVELVGFVRV